MTERKRKHPNLQDSMPSAEEVQEELSKVQSMDAFAALDRASVLGFGRLLGLRAGVPAWANSFAQSAEPTWSNLQPGRISSQPMERRFSPEDTQK